MSHDRVELAVVIPAYNEGQMILTTLDGWTRVMEGLGVSYEIHVYDGDSRDGTLDRIRSAMAGDARIKLHIKPRLPHGPAILLGYRENADKEWIFQVDADNEMPPDDFPLLWARRAEYDLLLGRRYGGRRPFLRKVISFFSRLIVGAFYGTGIHYVNSPYRLMRTSVFRLYFDIIPSDTVAPNLILSGIACVKHWRIYEMPVAYAYRTTGAVSTNVVKLFKAVIRSLAQTVRFRFLMAREGSSC